MSVMVVPAVERRPWPTLGPQVVQLIEDRLVFGPGDLHGQRAAVDDEKRALIYRMYEVFPKDHPRAGKRRFKRCAVSLRKGTAKTELAAWLAACELHPEGPVRCDGWRRVGSVWEPVGAPVRDPYIPMVAYTEEQTEDLAYGALHSMLSECPDADLFDIGLERIMRTDGHGVAMALANAPDSRDGARTTFQHFDETHRFDMPRLRQAHKTMLANIPKRPIADPWSLETTTMYSPGSGSVAESTMNYARKIAAGAVSEPQLFFFHRQADQDWNINDRDQLYQAVVEASGPVVAAWSDIDTIVAQFAEPDADRPYLRRVWLNQPWQSFEKAFDSRRWVDLARPAMELPDRPLVTLGWHGARYWDAAALVATEMTTGHQWPLFIDERPADWDGPWEVDGEAADAAVADAMETLDVWRFYVHPERWESNAASWAANYGADRVLAWRTNAWTKMTQATRAYVEAVRSGDCTNDGDARMAAHIGAAHRRVLSIKDEDGTPMWVPVKETASSPHPINAAMAGILSWQGRLDGIKAGMLEPIRWAIA